MRLPTAVLLVAAAVAPGGCAGARDVAVPVRCTAAVNAQLAGLIAHGYDGPVDNVMVCGTAFASSRPLGAGPRGGHELIPLRISLPDGTSALIEVVTNDNLDGVVTAPRGAHVAAYGQYYLTTERQRPFVAGIHETHCATHRGADNGWIVVDAAHYPPRGCAP